VNKEECANQGGTKVQLEADAIDFSGVFEMLSKVPKSMQ